MHQILYFQESTFCLGNIELYNREKHFDPKKQQKSLIYSFQTWQLCTVLKDLHHILFFKIVRKVRIMLLHEQFIFFPLSFRFFLRGTFDFIWVLIDFVFDNFEGL